MTELGSEFSDNSTYSLGVDGIDSGPSEFEGLLGVETRLPELAIEPPAERIVMPEPIPREDSVVGELSPNCYGLLKDWPIEVGRKTVNIPQGIGAAGGEINIPSQHNGKFDPGASNPSQQSDFRIGGCATTSF